jgi:precorrin-6Y C5,15-methyltransferase (decarboxylating)
MDNALALGVPKFDVVLGHAPDVLADLPAPDAVFIGGGLSEPVADLALDMLKPLGRLVANAVTLESEAVLFALHARLGGEMTRLSIARARPVGRMTGWGPMMPVTQWSLLTR